MEKGHPQRPSRVGNHTSSETLRPGWADFNLGFSQTKVQVCIMCEIEPATSMLWLVSQQHWAHVERNTFGPKNKGIAAMISSVICPLMPSQLALWSSRQECSRKAGRNTQASLFVLRLKFLYYLFCFICVCVCVCTRARTCSYTCILLLTRMLLHTLKVLGLSHSPHLTISTSSLRLSPIFFPFPYSFNKHLSRAQP